MLACCAMVRHQHPYQTAAQQTFPQPRSTAPLFRPAPSQPDRPHPRHRRLRMGIGPARPPRRARPLWAASATPVHRARCPGMFPPALKGPDARPRWAPAEDSGAVARHTAPLCTSQPMKRCTALVDQGAAALAAGRPLPVVVSTSVCLRPRSDCSLLGKLQCCSAMAHLSAITAAALGQQVHTTRQRLNAATPRQALLRAARPDEAARRIRLLGATKWRRSRAGSFMASCPVQTRQTAEPHRACRLPEARSPTTPITSTAGGPPAGSCLADAGAHPSPGPSCIQSIQLQSRPQKSAKHSTRQHCRPGERAMARG